MGAKCFFRLLGGRWGRGRLHVAACHLPPPPQGYAAKPGTPHLRCKQMAPCEICSLEAQAFL